MRQEALLFIFLSSFFLGFAQNMPKGEIIDSLKVDGANDSFALYLPTSYNASESNPVVFIFEPAARSKIGIRPFIESSEAYGYILVCSNNARNGPYNTNFEIANRLFTHIFSTFNINNKEIYMAGFSGGARLATAIGALVDKTAGVIACGAGFSHVPEHRPSTQKFAYVGLCGDRDFNFSEMINVKTYLEKLDFTHTVYTYKGHHDWPSSGRIKKAFDWLQIQAHLSKRKEISNEVLKKYYKSDYHQARTFEQESDWLKASSSYKRMLATYDELFTVDSIQKHYEELSASKEFKQANRLLTTALSEEAVLNTKFLQRFLSDMKDPDSKGLSWWKKQFDKLKKQAKKSDLEQEKMIDRVKNNIGALTWSRQNPNLYQASQVQKEFCQKLAQLMNTTFSE